MAGWAEFRWVCEVCGKGSSLADHDRRAPKARFCTGTFERPHGRREMKLTITPLLRARPDNFDRRIVVVMTPKLAQTVSSVIRKLIEPGDQPTTPELVELSKVRDQIRDAGVRDN